MNSLTQARVKELYVAPAAGALMQSVERVDVSPTGIVGDRYGEGIGRFTHAKRRTIRHVSLIAIEAVAAANQQLEVPFLLSETRRNIVTEGIKLNELIGVEFQIGGVGLRGVELCTPCRVPSTLSGKANFLQAFEGRGGLRAEVIMPGAICLHDAIMVRD